MVDFDLEEDRPYCPSGCRHKAEENSIHTAARRRKGAVVEDVVGYVVEGTVEGIVEDIVDIEIDRIVVDVVQEDSLDHHMELVAGELRRSAQECYMDCVLAGEYCSCAAGHRIRRRNNLGPT